MSQIDLSHVQIQGVSCAIFHADATTKSQAARSQLLLQLTAAARAARLRVEKAALAYEEFGRLNFFGTEDLVSYLSRSGLPQVTHTIDI